MTSRFIIPAALIIGAALLLPQSAKAEDISLHFNTGAAIPSFNSQYNNYKVGLGGDLSLQVPILRNLTVGPQLAAATFQAREGSSYRHGEGSIWSEELAFRFQGDHTSRSWWSPWIGGSGGVAEIARLVLPVVDASAGVDIATSKDHSAYIGVFGKFTHAFIDEHGNNVSLITHGDSLNYFTVGISGTWDFPAKAPAAAIEARPTIVREFYYTETRVVEKPIIVTQDTGNDEVAPAPSCDLPVKPFSMSGKVYFDRDQSVLTWQSKDALDGMITNLKANPEVKVNVVGNASQDHPKMTPAQIKHDADLAVARGQVVVSYLTAHGINASRIASASMSAAGHNATTESQERTRNATLTVETATK